MAEGVERRGATYDEAGVSLTAADEAVARLGPHVRSTRRAGVLSDVGAFGGMVALPAGYRQPVLVSATDGVGTKLKVAETAGRFDSIGIDLVAMCVDDIAVQGADPLFFLDYIGVGRLDPSVVEAVVAGVAEGCRQAGCSLVGGEVAEHGEGHSMDLAGFAVGVVERDAIIDGSSIEPGDVLLGLPSPGLRSNGYSLARRVLLDQGGLPLDGPAWPGAEHSLADELLRPSIVYSPVLARLCAAVTVHGLAHVTGGGLAGNLVRILPAHVDALVYNGRWPEPAIFGHIRALGPVAEDEMARVFNLGIGLVAVVPPDGAPAALDVLGEAYVIGEVVDGAGQVHLVA